MNKFELLKKYFGHNEFRYGQEELIDNILSGKDSLGIMPTGSGKSICYQIPALLTDGITIVISPLISLMKDQVQSVSESGIDAAFINSSLSYPEFLRTMKNASEYKYKIIYVTPERLSTESFLNFANNINISIIAVDEAHCVSQWGQDFRPSYLKIIDFIEKLSYKPVIAAFTATATREVRDDIIYLLKLNDPYIITTGFDRKNLYFEVRKPQAKFVELCQILNQRREKSGIIYCLTRKSVEEVCDNLNSIGYSVTRYHAGLHDNERFNNQDDFIYDRKQIMVATNAFGMGIDKSNVSFVIHYNMPKNLENYYQEAGRAGRDGEAADCILLYSGQDVHTNMYLIENTFVNLSMTPEMRDVVKNKDKEKLKLMTYYCNTESCLRKYILNYFGDSSPERCDNCGNCRSGILCNDETHPESESETIQIDFDLLKELHEVRRKIAANINVPPYTIFTDAVLHEICRKLPRSVSDMGRIQGIGVTKLNRHGYKFISAVNAYIDGTNNTIIEDNIGKQWSDAEDKTLEKNYLNGLSLKEIAELHGRSVDEIKCRIDYLDLEWNF